MGSNQFILPSGITSIEARIIYTESYLKTADQFTKELADTTVIAGLRYYAKSVEDWTGFGLSPDHYKVLFIRDDQPTNGGL
jgi:hypothetical protein